ncbi:MAG: O-acetylserine/cysteine exporter, partial [Verrucomicrobiales bacterium VVV1]
MSAALPFRHLCLALVVVSIWGANFVAVKIALMELPPLLLCALRFVVVVVPAIFFVPRPAVTLRQLLLYGLTMFALQFAFLFTG